MLANQFRYERDERERYCTEHAFHSENKKKNRNLKSQYNDLGTKKLLKKRKEKNKDELKRCQET